MTPLATALWLGNAALDTAGHLALKAAAVGAQRESEPDHWRTLARQPWLWFAIGCYVLEIFAWVGFLSQVPLSRGVLLGSFNIVILAMCGRIFFNERLTKLRVGGISLVAFGVALVGLGT